MLLLDNEPPMLTERNTVQKDLGNYDNLSKQKQHIHTRHLRENPSVHPQRATSHSIGPGPWTLAQTPVLLPLGGGPERGVPNCPELGNVHPVDLW